MSLLHRPEGTTGKPSEPEVTPTDAAEVGPESPSETADGATSAKEAARQAREAAEAARLRAEEAEAEAIRIEQDEAARQAAAAAADAAEQEAATAEAAAAQARAHAAELRASAGVTSASKVDLVKRTADTGAVVRPGRIRRVRRAVFSLRTVGFTAAVLVLAALCTVSGLMITDHRDAVTDRDRAADFTAAARQGVINVTSLDYRNAKRDVDRITNDSSGSFADDFAQRSDAFISVVEQSKVITVGSVTATGVESMNDNSAEVLVAATSTVSNAAGAKQEPRVWRLRVNVSRSGDDYKMAKVEFVP